MQEATRSPGNEECGNDRQQGLEAMVPGDGAGPGRRRRQLIQFAGAAALTGLGGKTFAQGSAANWPNRPIKMIVPFAVGGATDIVARLVSQKLSEALGQPVVVDNRGGANGVIGTEAVARAEPDGYTLLMNTAGAQTLSPALYKANYKPLESFEPICLIARIGFVLLANPDLPVKSVDELKAYLAKPGAKPLSMSSGSSMLGLITEEFKISLGAKDIVNAQYKGTGPQLQAVVGGEVDLTIDPFVGMAMIKAGRVRPLAVFSDTRSATLPDVPTLKEAGVPDMVFSSWAGLLAPAGTPAPIIDRLSKEMMRIVAEPAVQEGLKTVDYESVGSTPAEFAKVIKDDAERWARIAKTSPFKPGS